VAKMAAASIYPSTPTTSMFCSGKASHNRLELGNHKPKRKKKKERKEKKSKTTIPFFVSMRYSDHRDENIINVLPGK
jgi:ribosomal protein L39E